MFSEIEKIELTVLKVSILRHRTEGSQCVGKSKQLSIPRFSMPYGKIVDCWQRENVMPAMPEEEYPIYQSASFRRLLFVVVF